MAPMTVDPLYAFVFAGLFSPGPNVILVTASGARFGFRKTIPHVLGIVIGVGVTSGLTGLGLGTLLLARPELEFVLKIIAAGWILYMAWTLFNAQRAGQQKTRERPFTLFEAVLFQWVNPKVWAIALAASSGYSIGLPATEEALRLASAFSGINLFVCLFWSYAGSLLSYLLSHPSAWQLFMRGMAALLAVSAVMVFL